ncbi:MAG: Trk system potassium transporter TrkA [Duodenibacillus sp.]|nr:Trk system potassium transporter TrkA [Duodenibacillus sp.]
MHIIIIGAGRIGSSVAESLVSEANDITVIDRDARRIEQLQDTLDLRGIIGDATSPSILADAGAADADMLVAVTASDETNLVVSLLAARLFNIPTRVARVRNSELRAYPRLLAEEGFEITSAIWPEEAITNSIKHLIDFPEALQIIEFADGKASLIAVRAIAGSPLVGRPIRELAVHLPNVPARIVSVFRRNRHLDISADTVIESGDEVIVLSATRDIRRVAGEFRRNERPNKNIIIGGNLQLALQLARVIPSRAVNIKIIESDNKRSRNLAEKIPENSIILTGSITDETILDEAGIDTCDLFIALGRDDENNILSSLLAKKLGARRVIALINRQTYADLMQGTQIDITVSMTQATHGELLKHVRRGDVIAAHSLRRGVAEALEMVAHGDKKSSKVVGRKIKQLQLPDGVSVAAIVREVGVDEPRVLMGEPSLEIQTDDRVILFVSNKRLIPKVESLFTVDVGFF